MSYIFISYNQDDSDFAAVLMMHIEKAGFDTWMDKNRLRPGADWSEEIDRGIREALAMVVVMSPEAKASEYVTYEWSFAVGAEIPVIPILYKQTTLHPRLSRYQYLNFLYPSVRPWDQLVGEIKEINKLRARMRLDSTTPAYIRQAIGALDSANPTDRKGGIFILAEAADRNTIAKEALRVGINHPLFDVRALAAGKLVLIDPDATNDSLLNALDEGLTCGNEEIREVIQVGIGSASASASALLIKCVVAKNIWLRNLSVRTLGAIREKDAVEYILPMLTDAKTCYHAVNALGQIGDKTAISRLIAIVEPCCAEKVIASLASALVLLEAHEAAPKLLEVLSAWVGPSYRSPLFEVAIALGLLDSDSNTIDGLIAALSSEDPGAQAGSALALGMLKEQRAVDQLVKIFRSDLRRGGERPLTEALYDIPDDLSYNSLKALLISGSSGTKGILSEVAEFALLKSGIPEAVMAVEAAWK